MSEQHFSFEKLSEGESHRLADVLETIKHEYGATIKETADQVFVTAENKAGEKVTYGFTKVGNEVMAAGKQIDFAKLIAQTIQEKCQKKIAE